MTMEVYILLGAWFASTGLLLAVIWGRKWHFDRKKLRRPVTEKLLRAPSEGLQKKLEEIEDQLSTELAMAFVVPLMCISLYLLERRTASAGPASVGLSVVGGTAFTLICRKTLRRWTRSVTTSWGCQVNGR